MPYEVRTGYCTRTSDGWYLPTSAVIRHWNNPHWSSKLLPFESLGAVSYSRSIVTMAISVAVCEIFSVREWRDLETQVRGRSRSLKMAPFDRPYATFYWSVYVCLSVCLSVRTFQTKQLKISYQWNLARDFLMTNTHIICIHNFTLVMFLHYQTLHKNRKVTLFFLNSVRGSEKNRRCG